jgi:hypothetical protein
MSASTNTQPNPIPQEKCVDAFNHVLENIFCYGEQGKLWDTFKYYWMDDETQFCIYTLISLSQADIEELVVPEARGKTSPITGAYKWSIYIFQAWYRDLLLKNEWDDDMKIFVLNWSQYNCFCCKYQRDKVATMPTSAIPIGYKQPIDPIARWDKGVQQDPSDFPTLKEMKQWDKWKCLGMAMATAQLTDMSGARLQL